MAESLKFPCLMGPDFCLSTQEVGTLVAKLAHALMGLNLSPDKPLGLAADITPAGVTLILSCVALGLPVVMIPMGEPASSLDEWLAHLGVEVVITSSDMPNILALKTNKHYVSNLLSSHHNPMVLQDVSSHNFLSIIRTSGSTGAPKSAAIQFSAHRASAQSVTDYFAITKESCFGLNLPLFHVSGLSILFRALATGCAVFLAQNNRDLCVGLCAQKINHLSLVPAQLRKLLDLRVDLSRLQALIIGGDGLPEALATEALEQKIRLFSTYGLSETASMVYVYDHGLERGQILPHAKIKISPEDEIWVGGASLFRGYFPGLGMDQIEFFSTKDLGRIDDTGALQVFGRKDNQIICGGENILPEEIEHFLHNHPQILQCVVVGVADRAFGQRLMAFVRFRSEPMASFALVEYLGAYLPKFKIPKYFVPWPKACPLVQKKARMWLKNHEFLTSLS